MLVCDSLSTCLTKRMLIEYMLLYVVKWNIIRNQRTKNIAATLSASFAGKANLLYGFLIEMTGNNQSWQVGGWATPLKNMTSSIGMIRNSQYYWENKIWENKIDGNQTTNQMSKWIPSWSPWSIDIVLKPIVGHGRQPRIRPSQNKKHKLVLRLIWMFICIYIYIYIYYIHIMHIYIYIHIYILCWYIYIYVYIYMYKWIPSIWSTSQKHQRRIFKKNRWQLWCDFGWHPGNPLSQALIAMLQQMRFIFIWFWHLGKRPAA